MKNQIEDLIRQGQLHRYVRDQRPFLDNYHCRDRNSSPHPKGLTEKQIDIIVNDLASGGNSSLGRKAYARSTMEKRLRYNCDPEITFGSGNEEYPDHDDALVISAQIANA
ncbi:hypothetical protein BHE74_00047677 [Ensete ventricosum]|nr:hypothetical protein BHE74_00047677 [Ensete ventricosum]